MVVVGAFHEASARSTLDSAMGTRHILVFPLIAENPYQSLLYRALESYGYTAGEGELKLHWLARNRRRARVLHFHWPQPWYTYRRRGGPLTWIKLALFAGRLWGARALGYRIAWTIHEVYPLNPAPAWVDRMGSRILARASDVLLTNDEETAALGAAELGDPRAPITVVPHPAYLDAYPAGRDRAAVRAELGVPGSAFLFLLFGHVTAYKRIDLFVEAFRAVADENAYLLVAGLDQHQATADDLRAAAASDPRLKVRLEFIPDDRVAELFGACDAAIAPRQDGGTSGALVLALSLGVPVVAADVPTYRRVTAGENAAWLYDPGDRESMTAALRAAAADPATARVKGAAGRALVASASWEALAATTAARFDAALGVPTGVATARAPARESA